jgi:predicted NAD/FAD-binding protein
MPSVAIVGTGISGMGAAALLHPTHDITVYEKAAEIGGHTRTRNINYNGRTIAVDTGFIVFNYQNYPNLSAMFKHYQVPVEKSDMTFAVTMDDGAFEWGAKNLNALFGQRSNLLNPRFLRMIADVLHFFMRAPSFVERHPQLTLKQMLDKMGLGEWFVKYYILPMGGAIWSCPLDTILSFPALDFVRFFKAHGLMSPIGQPQWYTVTGGSQEYVKRLTAPYANRIRTNCGATAITRNGNKVSVQDARGETREYDHVVLACHGDEALALLKDASLEERSVLGAFHYQKNRAFLHKDVRIMPKRRRCWASWVYHSDKGRKDETIPVTYWMNLLQNIDNDYPLFVTLNPIKPIAPEHIFDEHEFEHPVYTIEAMQSQKLIHSLQGKRNTWFCGAHLRNGFHEDGLASAVAVAERMGIKKPW